MKVALKNEAIKLRNAGWSYNIIADRLQVSKSTLSLWLREIPYIPNQTVIKRVNNALLKSVMIRHQEKIRSLDDAASWAKNEIGNLSQRDLIMVGLGLYIGEGSKNDETTTIINSNPDVLRLAILWLRRYLKVPLKNFRVILHIYPDNSEVKAKRYWSRILGIPLSQFEKIQIDRRLNKSRINHRKLPHGTAHIKIRSCGNKQFGVLLHRRIMGLIGEIYNQMRV